MRITSTLVAAIAFFAVAPAAQAQLATADQTVNMSVSSINSLSFASSVSLTVNAGTIGSSSLTPATASSTYGIISNDSSAKLSASIDIDMPAGSSLEVNLAAPTGGTAVGSTALSTVPVDLVTAIPAVSESGVALTYKFTRDIWLRAEFRHDWLSSNQYLVDYQSNLFLLSLRLQR